MKKYIKDYFEFFGYCEDQYVPCEVCRNPAQDIHHIIYKSQGGKDEVGNLIGLCRDCHDKAHFKKEPYLYSQELQDIHNRFLEKSKKN